MENFPYEVNVGKQVEKRGLRNVPRNLVLLIPHSCYTLLLSSACACKQHSKNICVGFAKIR